MGDMPHGVVNVSDSISRDSSAQVRAQGEGYTNPSFIPSATTSYRRKSPAAVLKWLTERGVTWERARKFAYLTGCDSIESLAVYLRFQLPPLWDANEDSINIDMREMFGVNAVNTRRIIQGLDVMSTFHQHACAFYVV